jgi:ABC-type transport system involved in cytochrome bd biosynthesis fused ATPase/permease subunit
MHALPDALAAGWIDTGRTLGTNLENLLLQVGVPLIAVISVAVVWFKTRSAPAAIVAIILGAIVIWGASNMTTLSSKTGQDVNTGSSSSSGIVGNGLSSAAGGGSAVGTGQR